MVQDNGGNADIVMSGVGTNKQCEDAPTVSFGSANINNADKGNIYHALVTTTTLLYTRSYHPTRIPITIRVVYNYHIYYKQVTMQKCITFTIHHCTKRNTDKLNA